MILDTIKSVTTAILPEYKEKFLKNFEQLYQLPILRPMLNLVVTKAKYSLIEFEVKPSKVWNRLAGQYHGENIFKRIGGIFSKKHKILIKKIIPEVIIHEIAHAIEKEIKINLNEEFRIVLALDMKNKVPHNAQLARAVELYMHEHLKKYKSDEIMEELFARYFELLAMSYEVGGWGEYQFYYKDISEYFTNTTKWVEETFNNWVNDRVDLDLIEASQELVTNLKPYKKEWSKDIKSGASKTPRPGAKGKWTGQTRSVTDWQKSWEQYNKEKTK